jgi:anti-sigma regulatory factor (Ser/Thr protein kinase)
MSELPSADVPGAMTIRTTSDAAEIAPIRRQVESFVASHAFDEKSVAEVGLCVNEAIANIIRHAYRGKGGEPIEVTMSVVGEELEISLRDWGEGIKPGPLPEHKMDPMNPGGLGLLCLGRLMDRVTFTPQYPGMLLEMTKRRTQNISA